MEFGKTLNQCLQVASGNGHEQTIECLIKAGANVGAIADEVVYTNGSNRSLDDHPLFIRRRPTQKLSALQAALTSFQRFGPRTLITSLQHHFQSTWIGADASSQQRSIEKLLAKGADPNRIDGQDMSPLDIAAACCTVEVVQSLTSSGTHLEAAMGNHGNALRTAARRELGGFPIIKILLETSPAPWSTDHEKAAALNKALAFFATPSWLSRECDGKSEHSTSIEDVLSTGPGAVVKFLLADLPEEEAEDSRYGLLAQMACMAGDQACVELLLQRNMNVNVSGNYYGTALQAASRVGNTEIVEHLVSSGADVNILQGAHGTAIRAAVRGGHEDVVRILIASGADTNLRYKNRAQDTGESILHLALTSRNLTVFEILCDAGADWNTDTADRQPILITACKKGEANVAEFLLANGVDVNVLGNGLGGYSMLQNEDATPLHAACANGHVSVVRLLLDYGADLEMKEESIATPLIAAVRGDSLAVVRLLLDAGANVNHGIPATPLSTAAASGNIGIFEELLSVGAIVGGPSIKTNALAVACNRRQYDVVETLLEALYGTHDELEICWEAFTAIQEHGDEKIARLLLERGVSPSFSMLCQACSAGLLEMVRLLLESEIGVNEDDDEDGPLLHVAAYHSRPQIVQLLIHRGADITLRSTRYGSPMIATLEGSMVPFLQGYRQPNSCRALANQLPLSGPCMEGLDQVEIKESRATKRYHNASKFCRAYSMQG